MHLPKRFKLMLRIVEILVILYVLLVVIIYFAQRSLLYFPSHGPRSTALAPWSDGATTIGYCREVEHPRTVWLLMHGNAGQAAHRDYVLPRMSGEDSLYVLEYPGYGDRPGRPSMASINKAASAAYRLLRSRYPGTPVCALAESIGSGPACALAREPMPPDKIVLLVPFDSLVSVAAEHFPFLPVRFMLRDRWDNVASLKGYQGVVQIFGAQEDTIIPMAHAKALASQVPGARFTAIPGGHNDWSEHPGVVIQR